LQLQGYDAISEAKAICLHIMHRKAGNLGEAEDEALALSRYVKVS